MYPKGSYFSQMLHRKYKKRLSWCGIRGGVGPEIVIGRHGFQTRCRRTDIVPRRCAAYPLRNTALSGTEADN